MAIETPAQSKTVERVMHEFKQGKLKSAGHAVRDRRQAVAIGLSEAGVARKQPARRKDKAK